MPITLEALEAKQNELAELIAKFKAQPMPLQFPVTIALPHLHDGETYVGTIITPDGRRPAPLPCPRRGTMRPSARTPNWTPSKLPWSTAK